MIEGDLVSVCDQRLPILCVPAYAHERTLPNYWRITRRDGPLCYLTCLVPCPFGPFVRHENDLLRLTSHQIALYLSGNLL